MGMRIDDARSHNAGDLEDQQGTEPSTAGARHSDQPVRVEQTSANLLKPGDQIMWGTVFGPYEIVHTLQKRKLGGRLVNQIALVDYEDKVEHFQFSSHREFTRLVKPVDSLAPWEGNPPISPLQGLRSMAKEDSLLYRFIYPLTHPVATFWRWLLDLRWLFYFAKMGMGFVGVSVILVVSAIALASNLPLEFSVAISMIGAFAMERVWVYWKQRMRRKMAKGAVISVQFRPFNAAKVEYGTLMISRASALILDTGKWWESSRLKLRKGKQVKAICTFANDLDGNTAFPSVKIANAIRHRIRNGSWRVVYGTTKNYNPVRQSHPDVVMYPNPREERFNIHLPNDDRKAEGFSIGVKFAQMKVFAETLEVMNDQ